MILTPMTAPGAHLRLFRSTLAWSLVLTACTSAQPCHLDASVQLDAGVDAGTWPIGFVGQPLQLTATSPLAACGDALTSQVDLISPSTASVEVTQVGQVHLDDGRLQVEFAFTPPEPGEYQVVVTFEPNLGVHREKVVVAEVASLASATVVQLPAVCSQLLRLAPDGFICLTDNGVEVWRGADLMALFQGQAVTTAGDAIWSTSPTGVLERRDGYGTQVTRNSSQPFTGELTMCEDNGGQGFRAVASTFGSAIFEATYLGGDLLISSVSQSLAIGCFYDDSALWAVGSPGDPAASITAEAVWFRSGHGFERPYRRAAGSGNGPAVQLALPNHGAWARSTHWGRFEVPEGWALAPVTHPTTHWEAWPTPVLGMDDDVVFLPGPRPDLYLMVRRPGR